MSVCIRLEKLLANSTLDGQLEIAVHLAIVYLALLGEANYPDTLFEHIFMMEPSFHSLKGDLYLQLAQHAGKLKRVALMSNYLSEADVHFTACRNKLGSVETSIVRTSEPFSDLESKVAQLNSIAEELIASDYPKWLPFVANDLSCLVLGVDGGAPCSDAHRIIEHSCRFKALEVCKEVGARLMWGILHLRSMSLELIHGTFGKVLEAKTLLNSDLIPDGPSFKGRYCAFLALAYSDLCNIADAEEWAALALKYANDGGSAKLISEITRFTSIVEISCELSKKSSDLSQPMAGTGDLSTHVASFRKRYETFEPRAMNQIQADLQADLVQSALDKLLSLINYLCVQRGTIVDPSLEMKIEEMFNWAEQIAQKVSEEAIALADVTEQRVSSLCPITEPDRDLKVLQRAAEIHSEHHNAARRFLSMTQLELSVWRATANQTYLLGARTHCALVCKNYQSVGALQMAAICQQNSVEITEEIANISEGFAAQACLTKSLEHLQTAADIYDTLRQDLSAVPGLDALNGKQGINSARLRLSIYSRAVRLCLGIGLIEECWNWIQSSKARSVSDLMGMGSIIPSYLAKRITTNSKAVELLQEESRLVELVDSKPREQRLEYRIQLQKHREAMKTYPELRELQALREGCPETTETIRWLFPVLESPLRRVVLVDWLCVESGVFIAILDVARGRRLEISRISANIETVRQWVDSWLHDCRVKSPNPGPVDINQLVQPLTRNTQPGDLLVLSPSGPLHSLPLHALQVDNQILIERNPVVYCPNLSILHQCFLRSTAAQEDIDKSVPLFMGVYEDMGKEKQRHEISTSLKRWAQLFGGRTIWGKELTRAIFQKEVQCATLIHFHGHLRFGINKLDDALELTYGNDERHIGQHHPDEGFSTVVREPSQTLAHGSITPEEDDYDPPIVKRKTPERLKVRDIFSMKIPPAIVTLIACSSGNQEIKAGDEPMGFVTAFLYAGATSVLGTLWNIESVNGMWFTNLFYDHIRSQMMQSMQGRRIDLAIATQQAICQIRRKPDTSAPYYWAAFVLHGAWEVKPFVRTFDPDFVNQCEGKFW